MRIGLFSDTFPPEINGVANSTNILFQTLLAMGHEVYVVTTRKGAGTFEWDDDERVMRLAGLQLKQLYGYVATSPFHFHAMNEIKRLNLDVIHVQTEYGVGIFARICAKQLGIPLVSTYHTTYEDYTHYANPMNLDRVDDSLKKMVARLSKLYGDSSQQVIAPSIKTKALLRSYHVNTNIQVLPTGLMLDKFHPQGFDVTIKEKIRNEYGISMEEKLVVYVGRIAEEKALDLVIEGFAKAKEENHPVKLLIVGDGPDLPKLKKLANQLDVEDVVKFAGKKDASLVPDYYRSADAFVSASLTETQGMTYIEALASGIILFARYDEVLDELLIDQKTGYFFKDAKDLSDQLETFLQLDETTYAEMKKACLQQVQPYSAYVFASGALKIYQDAIHFYENMFVVDDIRVKNNTVQLSLVNLQEDEISMLVSFDDYLDYGIRKGDKLPFTVIEELQSKEQAVLAYESCIKKISIKDRTRKEMYDYLKKTAECNEATIQNILDRLQEKGLINDRAYAKDNISRMKVALFGEQRIVNELMKKGIAKDIVESEIAQLPKEEEYENALRYAKKIKAQCKEDSVRLKKNKIVRRLQARGYQASLAYDVVNELDFSEDGLNELESLRRCALKAKKRYERKYSDTQLRNRVYGFCASKGYNSEDIYVILDEMEWEND